MKIMTKILSILLISLLIPQGFIFIGSHAEEQSEQEINFSVHNYTPDIIEESTYVTFNFNDIESFSYQPGHPQLPKINKQFILPAGSKINDISIKQSQMQSIVIKKPLKPCENPIPTSDILIKEPSLTENQQIYSKDQLYPQKNYETIIGRGLYNNELVTYVTIIYYPYQYNPVKEKIYWSDQTSFTILYTPPTSAPSTIDEYDLVIIAPNQFKQTINPLVQHKNTYQIKTYIKTTEEIYSEYEGRDHQEQIKYFIYDAVKNQGVKYVLLMGNIDLVPMRQAAIRVYHDDDILTDLYYADVFNADGSFSSWDTNNNNLFSEYDWDNGLKDDVDLYPDVHVGRLPCKNTDEVSVVVNIIINYESLSAQEPWFKRMLLIAGDTFPNNGVIEGELVTSIIGEYMQQYGFELVKLWTSLGTFRPLNINKEINKGAGFISYSGHGYEQGFGTSPPNVEQRIDYYSPYLYGLFNGNKLPVIFWDACSTTKLDFTVEDLLEWYPEILVRILTMIENEPYEMDTMYPCFAWELVKKSNGGSIGSIGSTRVAFTGVDQNGAHWGAGYLNTHFYENYQPGKTLGELFTNSQIDYLNGVGNEYITLEEFILVGDPSLMLGGYS